MLKWIGTKGQHLYIPPTQTQLVEEFRLDFDQKRSIAIDGEKYMTKHAIVKLGGPKLKFIGQVAAYEEWEKKIIKDLDI